MAALEQVGDKTMAAVNQDVHSWMDDADRRIRALIGDTLSALASAAVAALAEWQRPKG